MNNMNNMNLTNSFRLNEQQGNSSNIKNKNNSMRIQKKYVQFRKDSVKP